MEERQILFAFYIFIVVFSFLIVFGNVRDINEDSLFNKKYLSIQLGLIEDAVMSAPGDVRAELGFEKMKEFSFEFDKCSVIVGDKGIETRGEVEYECNEDNSMNKDLEWIEDFDVIVFEKDKNGLRISGKD